MHISPDDLYEQLVEAGEKWADLNAAADMLEESLKSLVSQLASDSNESSVAARTAFAHRHPEYKGQVKQMVEARTAANKAKVRYDAKKVYVELLRTQSANERSLARVAP